MEGQSLNTLRMQQSCQCCPYGVSNQEAFSSLGFKDQGILATHHLTIVPDHTDYELTVSIPCHRNNNSSSYSHPLPLFTGLTVTHCDVGACSCNGPSVPEDSSIQAAGACPQLHPHRRQLQVRNLACSETTCSLSAWLFVTRSAEPVIPIQDVTTKLPLCFLVCPVLAPVATE